MKKQIKPTSRRAILAFALTVLMLTIATMGVVNATGDQAQKVGQDLGIPDDAVQYNRTDTTPIRQMEQVRAMETYAFNYRNLTLVLNCTRNCEFNVTADPTLKPKVLSLSIEPNQNMTLAVNMTGAPLEAEMVKTQTLNFYLGLEPNATIELKAQIRLHINQTELSQELNREVNASRLTWMYWNTTQHQWVQVPSWIDPNNYLACNTTHFSTWTIAEVADQLTPQPENSASPLQTEAPTASASAVPSITVDSTDKPSQTSQPGESQLPSPSISAVDPENNSTEQKSIPVEYILVGVAGAIVAIVAVGFLALRKR